MNYLNTNPLPDSAMRLRACFENGCRGRPSQYVYNEAPPQTDELRTACENSAHLSIFLFVQMVSVVGTSRCDVRAACSGATPSNAPAARTCVPPATTRPGTAQRAIPTIPLNTYVAGRHRRAACATSKPFFKHALNEI